MRTRRTAKTAKTNFNPIILVGVLMTVSAAIAVPVYSVKAHRASKQFPGSSKSMTAGPAVSVNSVSPATRWSFASNPLLPLPPPAAPAIATYQSDCTTPATSFSLGDTVCAKIVGAPQPVGGRASARLGWVSPYGALAQGADITTDPQTGNYVIPATAFTTLPPDPDAGTSTFDNRGVWTLALFSTVDASQIVGTNFTVSDPNKEFVDLSVHQSLATNEMQVNAGSGNVFKIFVSNRGPSSAHDVVLTDTVPANTSFSSMVETTSVGFTCGTPDMGGVFTCTLATMPAGTTAEFKFSYNVDNGTADGTVITNNVSVASSATPCDPETTCELVSDDNTNSIGAVVPTAVGAETCTLVCDENFSVIANTTQGGNPGAFVNFASASPFGNCGAITASPASGTFFGLGTTVVNVTSDTGGGNCSFTITVVQGTPPSITCPPDKTATADNTNTHTFTAPQIGTPTTTPSTNVVVTFERSDNVDATYDANGNIVTPAVIYSLTDPFQIGTTGITWTVTDANGLTASCTQKIVVHAPCASDAQPPTITAPPDITTSTGPNSTTCGVVLDDELGQPNVQDDCSATFTVSGVPPGNLFPVGTTTLTYTARDGAGHTATAQQHVTVTDNTPPVIFAPPNASYTCPNEVPPLSASQAFGPNIIVNGQEVPGPVFDNCGSPAVTASQTVTGAGSVASPLVIIRTYTALDSHGNSASAVQVITVIDPTPPVFTFVPADVTAYTGPDATTCDTVVSPGTATATDNCGVVTVTRSPSGNTFAVGTTTITWTATDGAGNTTTATQTVTVIDNTVPVITTNGQTLSMWPPNHRYQTFQLTQFVTGASDNCGGVTINDVVIEKVTSDEVENGNGSGNTTNDMVIAADCKSVQLRSEREGEGDGRVYTITLKVTDTHGNVGRATAKVVVPHNPGETVVDSGVHYTVNGTCP